MTKPKAKKNMTWAMTPEDQKLIGELKAKTGIQADSEVVRMGLRALAAQQARATNG